VVNVLAGILDDNAFAFRLVEGHHDSCEKSLFVNVTEWFLFPSLLDFPTVEIVGFVVEVVNEAYEILFVDLIEVDVLSFVTDEPFDCAFHQCAAGSLPGLLIIVRHLLAVIYEIALCHNCANIAISFEVLGLSVVK